MDSNSVLKDIGRSYIVSSFIPAGLFLAIAVLFLQDFAPFALDNWLESTSTTFAEKISLLVLLVFWIGFALYSSWNWTVDFFSGQFMGKGLSKLFARLVALQIDKEKVELINTVRKTMALGASATEEDKKNFVIRKMEAQEKYGELELYYPITCEDLSSCVNDPEKAFIHLELRPTRLGNLLKAMHIYSWKRYRLHADIVWPRLMNLFPPKYAQEFENSLINFGFLLNSSLLSFVLGSIFVILVVLRTPCNLISPPHDRLVSFYSNAICAPINQPANFIQRGFDNTTELRLFLLGTFFFISGYFLYSLSIHAAKHYSLLVRSGIDLYRFELLRGWCQRLPKSLEEERTFWPKFNQYIISGNDLSGKELNFYFIHDPLKRDIGSAEEEIIGYESVSDFSGNSQNDGEMMEMYPVRPAQSSDFPAIRELIRRVGINPLGLDWRRFVVAVDENGGLAGCGQVKYHFGGTREMASIAVLPELQGQGIGSLIVGRLLELHHPPLYLTCVASRSSFYRQFGFRVLDLSEMPRYFRIIAQIYPVFRVLFRRSEPLCVMAKLS